MHANLKTICMGVFLPG